MIVLVAVAFLYLLNCHESLFLVTLISKKFVLLLVRILIRRIVLD